MKSKTHATLNRRDFGGLGQQCTLIGSVKRDQLSIEQRNQRANVRKVQLEYIVCLPHVENHAQ